MPLSEQACEFKTHTERAAIEETSHSRKLNACRGCTRSEPIQEQAEHVGGQPLNTTLTHHNGSTNP